MLLEGLHIPLTTPFHPDGRLNPHKIAANVIRYSKTPAAGLIVLGPSGEPTLLSDDETREALRAAAQAAAPEKVLIAGISRDSVPSTLVLADYAAELNYDAILVAAPSMPITPRELLTYFQSIADRSPLPITLLSLPGRGIPTAAVVELAAHSRIIALLDTQCRNPESDEFEQLVRLTVANSSQVTVTHVFSAVTARMQRAAGRANPSLVSAASLAGTAASVAEPANSLRTRTKSVSFQVLAGDAEGMLDCLFAGAAGAAPAFAAGSPQACYEVFAAWKDRDFPLATQKQGRLRVPARLSEAAPGALKFACDLNGYFGGLPRLPHLPPTGEQRAALEASMKGLRS